MSHAAYALNSNTTWPADAWRLARARDAAVVRNDVAIARSRGAEIVIVSVHVFVEMTSRPDPADRALVEAFTAGGGVDLVVIHGPHVVQPVEVVNGAIVFWSLGNLVSGMGVWGRGKYSDARTLDGLLAAVRFTERTDGRFAADAGPVLTCQMVDGRVVHPGVAAVADPAAPTAVRSAARRCIDRSAPVVPGLR